VSAPTVVRLVLDRPGRANALDAGTVEQLHTAVADAQAADVVVLEARGRAFCAGLDLGDLDTETDASLLHRLVRVQLLLERVGSSAPLVVALVDGAAVGAGADLVLAAHVRLALPGASLRFPGSGFGAVLGTARLSAETSPSYAAELALSGRRVGRAEATARGLWQAVPDVAEAERVIAGLAASAQALPGATGARLRAAADRADGRHGDPLGDLVRSLASERGLVERVRSFRARSTTAAPPVPLTPGTPSIAATHHQQGSRTPEGAPA
jgi:enoyl-CoA hydratase